MSGNEFSSPPQLQTPIYKERRGERGEEVKGNEKATFTQDFCQGGKFDWRRQGGREMTQEYPEVLLSRYKALRLTVFICIDV